MNFPIYIQPDAMDCGPACLRMICSFYGKDYSLKKLREYTFIGKDGVSLMGISKAADKIGFKTIGGRVEIDSIVNKAILPCIIHWDQEHFVVLYKIKKKKNEKIFYIADPGKGLVQYKEREFSDHWISFNKEELQFGASTYLKDENYSQYYTDIGKIQNTRKTIKGVELFGEKAVNNFNFSASYTYLHSEINRDGKWYRAPNKMNYLVKLSTTYSNVKYGTVGLSFVSRPGHYYTPDHHQ